MTSLAPSWQCEPMACALWCISELGELTYGDRGTIGSNHHDEFLHHQSKRINQGKF